MIASRISPRLQILAFLVGNAISLIGNSLTLIALPWFVLDTTGSAGKTGLTGMAFALPAFLVGISGGALIDRLGGRRMSVIADIVSGVSVALIPLLHDTVGLQFWQLLVLVFLGAMLDIPGLTARRTILPILAERSGARPEAMNSAFEVTDALSIIIGPAIAGVLIAWLGAVNLLLIDAGTFAISALLIGLFTPDIALPAEEPSERRGWTTALSGMHMIVRDRLLLVVAIVLAFTNLLNGPFFNVIMPVIVDDRYHDASRYGLLLTAFGIGNLVGGTLYGVIGHRLRAYRRELWLLGIAAVVAMRWLLLPDFPFAILLIVMALTGLLAGPVNPLLVTVRFERIAPQMRGRVFSSFAAIASVIEPIGMAATGLLIEQWGLHQALVVTAIAFTIILLVLPFLRVIGEMNRRDDDATSPTATP